MGAAGAVDLIRQAVAATRAFYGEPPALGMVTFVDPRHVRPTMVRGKPVWGWTFLKAGFEPVGTTIDQGLLAFQLLPDRMPPPAAALQPGALGDLFPEAAE